MPLPPSSFTGITSPFDRFFASDEEELKKDEDKEVSPFDKFFEEDPEPVELNTIEASKSIWDSFFPGEATPQEELSKKYFEGVRALDNQSVLTPVGQIGEVLDQFSTFASSIATSVGGFLQIPDYDKKALNLALEKKEKGEELSFLEEVGIATHDFFIEKTPELYEFANTATNEVARVGERMEQLGLEWQKNKGYTKSLEGYAKELDEAPTIAQAIKAGVSNLNWDVGKAVYATMAGQMAMIYSPIIRAREGLKGLTAIQKAEALASPAAVSFGINASLAMKHNIEESYAKTQDWDYSLNAGVIKSFADAGVDTAAIPFMPLTWMKKPLNDVMAKWLGTAAASSAEYVGVRMALGEGVTTSDAFMNIGFNFLLGSPIDVALVGGIEKVKGVIKPNRLSPDMYAPSTVMNSVVNYARYNRLKVEMNSLEQSLDSFYATENQNPGLQAAIEGNLIETQPTQNDYDIAGANIPLQDQITITPVVSAATGVLSHSVNVSKNVTFSNGWYGNPGYARQRFSSAMADGTPINIRTNGTFISPNQTPTSFDNVKKGKVYGAWVEPSDVLLPQYKTELAALDASTTPLTPGQTRRKEALMVANKYLEEANTVGRQVAKKAMEFATILQKIFLPETALIITNKSYDQVHSAKRPRLDPLEFAANGGSLTSYLRSDGVTVQQLYVREAGAWVLKDDPNSPGLKQAVFDPGKLLSTLTHEFFHAGFVGKFNTASPRIRQAITTAYSNWLTSRPGPNASYEQNIDTAPGGLATLDNPAHAQADLGRYPEDYRMYSTNLPEFIANVFARELLNGEASKAIPEIKQFVAANKSWFESIINDMNVKLNLPETMNMSNVLLYLAADRKMQKEMSLIKEAENWTPGSNAPMPKRRVLKASPLQNSNLWNDMFMGLGQKVSTLMKSVEDSTKPYNRAERVAMMNTLRDLELDKTPDAAVSTLELAERFSQHLQMETAIEANYNALNPFTKFIKKQFGSTPTSAKWIGELQETGRISAIFKTLHQLAWDNPNNRFLQAHVKLTRQIVEIRNRALSMVEPYVKEVKGLTFEQKENVARYMFAKRSGMLDLLINDKAELLAKDPKNSAYTIEQLMDKAQDYVVRKDFGMTKDLLASTKNLFSYFNKTLLLREQAELNNVRKQFQLGGGDEFKLQNREAKIKARYRALRKQGDYFPAMRFGEYALKMVANRDMTFEGREIKKGETVWFESFESDKQRQEVWDDFKTSLSPTDFATTAYRVSDNIRNIKGMSMDFIYESRDAIQRVLEKRGLSIEQVREAMAQVDDLAKGYLNSSSFAKRLMRRKNVLGASTDLERILASYAESFGNDYSRLNTKNDYDYLLNDYRKHIDEDFRDIKTTEEKKHRERHDVMHSYMQKHIDYVFFPGWEGEGLKTLGFVYHLGFNVKSALVNMTSLPMYTYSYLGRQWGDVAAVEAISGAMKDVLDHGVNGKTQYSPLALEVLKNLRDTGVLSQSLSRDMASMALGGSTERIFARVAGKTGARIGRKARGFGHDLVNYSGALFQYTEMFARESAALATVKLAEKAGITDAKQVIALARDTVDKSMFEYGRTNRPKFMRGMTSPLFLFQQFVVNSLYFATRRNTTALRFALASFAAAGAMGLPGAEDVVDLIDAAGTMYSKKFGNGKPVDFRKMIRETLAGSALNSDFVLHGFGRNGGAMASVLGAVTGTDVEFDLSGSLSSGRVIPFNAARFARQKAYGADLTIGDNLDEIAGPAYAPIFNVLKAFQQGPDSWKRTEAMMPTALANASKAARYAIREEETDFTNSPIMKFDRTNPQDQVMMALQALGFPSTKLKQARELTTMRREHDRYWTVQKESLMEQMRYWTVQSARSDNSNKDEIRGIIEEIKRFNGYAPPQARIQAESLRKSVENKLKSDKMKELGFVTGNKTDIGRDFSALFPDIERRTEEEKKKEEVRVYNLRD